MEPCGPAGCECKDGNSNCLGPIVNVGGAEHRVNCCALCSITLGCVQWAISSGSQADEPALCWLKSKKGSQVSSSARVVGEVAAACVAPAAHSLASPAHAGTKRTSRCLGVDGASRYKQTGCPVSDWGTTFLLVIGVFAGIYFGGGAVYGARAAGAGRSLALRLHPVPNFLAGSS